MDDAGYGGFVSVLESTDVAYVCNFRAFSLSQTFTHACVLPFSMSADIFKTSSKISVSPRRRTLFGTPNSSFSISIQKWSFYEHGSSLFGKVVLPPQRGAHFWKTGFRASNPSFFKEIERSPQTGPHRQNHSPTLSFWVDVPLILPGFYHDMDSHTSRISLTYKPTRLHDHHA